MTDRASVRTTVALGLLAALLTVYGVYTLFDVQRIGDVDDLGIEWNCSNAFTSPDEGMCGLQNSIRLSVAAASFLVAALILALDWRRRARRRRRPAVAT